MEEVKDKGTNRFKRLFRMRHTDVKSFPGPYINPWLRLTIYLVMIFLTGCIYIGWNGIQELLYKAGSFEHLCEGATDISYISIGEAKYIDCGARKSGINNLYTIAFSTHFISSIISGIVLDNIGPKYCYVVGQFINIIVWIFISTFPKQPIVLYGGFFLIGLTAESIYMPLITVSYYFPENRLFIISCLGSTRSLSFVIPTILAAIFRLDYFKPDSLYIIGITYVILGNFFCLVVGACTIQRYFFIDESPAEPETPESARSVDESVNAVTNQGNGFSRIVKRAKQLYKHPQCLEYVLVTACISIFLTSMEFVNKSQREMLVTSDGGSVVGLFKYVNILTFLPAPLLGLLMDKFGPAVVFVLLHACCSSYYFCVAFDTYTMKLVACFFYFIAGSLFISSNYCYINRRFYAKNFGVLTGIPFVFAGLVTLTNIPLYNLGTQKLKHLAPYNFRPIALILMTYMIVCAFLSCILVHISKTNPVQVYTKKSKSSQV
ncbi:conserved hypothetical protein [Theileria equi strain WA]|uniref:Major facilitator superfamily MFS-1 protein n=1 Tax=Theileria equi strain WA TaxID=1537102 RepID=L1LBJ6_THEEQ|nr:conserved hypothetical protein [Theileria equi strain WA]EKX72645.1 conserved hypothetical protein [Theileria equi strain WA]|eukprot:XP_004832097.1 conserved hypothetical protein [Theileria equi strain WA]